MLPSGVGLGFTGAISVGRVRNSSDDQFSATLTSMMEDPDSDDLFFTSTLLIIDPVNGSELICSGTAASGNVFQGNVIVLSSGEYYTFILSCEYCMSSWKCYANLRLTRSSY